MRAQYGQVRSQEELIARKSSRGFSFLMQPWQEMSVVRIENGCDPTVLFSFKEAFLDVFHLWEPLGSIFSTMASSLDLFLCQIMGLVGNLLSFAASFTLTLNLILYPYSSTRLYVSSPKLSNSLTSIWNEFHFWFCLPLTT